MKIPGSKFVFASFLLSCLWFQSSSIAQTGNGERIALLIGNWDYNQNGRFDDDHDSGYASDLHSPCNDANHVRQQLEKDGFQIHSFCNKTRDEWAKVFQEFSLKTSNLPSGSIVFVYYSGHGIQHNGFPFAVPVGFQLDLEVWSKESETRKIQELRMRANDLTRALNLLNKNPKNALIIAIDACRDTPVGDTDVFNQAVSILVPYNAIVQYATTPGDRLPDTNAKVSDYARTLVAELAVGGDIGNAMARVVSKIWAKFLEDERNTYAEMNTGSALYALPFTPIRASQSTTVLVAQGPQGRVSTETRVIRNIEDGIRLDVFWCQGENERSRFDYAMNFARAVADRASEFKVGRVQVKVLTEKVNPQGYNVYRNLMRYDPKDVRERDLLVRLSSAFPEGNFLPRQGIGVRGAPTWNYVSAFVCSPAGL